MAEVAPAGHPAEIALGELGRAWAPVDTRPSTAATSAGRIADARAP